ncbi:hypothetical protein PHAVU_003G078200 [Phaseolus vulgaris]|uniref:Uncharacterized protein n=1 Tax=Phaseolus vulgaris TaxID=3885 RepID=V7C9I5_PHAVU|nr:hypothetical protein PHAVU_003G078200g [Phaseolus vulgaris]ESW25935.1 hypothetical protein PHAVU_003G078200g [Phaseolus vulgaris]
MNNTRKHPICSGDFPSATSPVNFRRPTPKIHLSARKLAARLWHFRFFHRSSSHKLQSSPPPRIKRTEEEATQGDGRKVLRDTKLIGGSVVSVLLSELLRAQTCINKLKSEQKSSKKKLEEEKFLWKRRELKKKESVLEDLKDKLARERRSKERMESLNSKLVHDLAEAKLYAEQFMINYKEERRKREITEEVCHELAMQIAEDRAKLEGIREEMEEERKMFHMAELWRDESIQMKLLDAKLALEDKYTQMIHLIAHLQSFLRSRGDELGASEPPNVELSCDFTKSNYVFDTFDEIKVKERVIGVESWFLSTLTAPSSTVHIVSLDEDHCLNNNLHNVDQNVNGLGSEAECCENSQDGCYKHSDSSMAQQNSQDPTFGECEGRLPTSSVKSRGFRQWELLRPRNFADSVNPHITRGMKGCIEWPRGMPKINSKIIPMEERVRKQKSQLQHLLKPVA